MGVHFRILTDPTTLGHWAGLPRPPSAARCEAAHIAPEGEVRLGDYVAAEGVGRRLGKTSRGRRGKAGRRDPPRPLNAR